MNYESALAYMEGLIGLGWKLGNERFSELCRRLGDPQKSYRIVHVAGTKGKGSTTALSAAILHRAGYRVGAYLSPYVYDVRERVQIDGEMIGRSDFAALVTQVAPVIEELARTEFGPTTEFELKTIIGFLAFVRLAAEFACIEVGLGGRLDATNVVSPMVTVITNIGLDHTQILGDTHELIAAEKAGIIKPGIPCITATDHAGALSVIRAISEERGAPLVCVETAPSAKPTGKAELVTWESLPVGRRGWAGNARGLRVATQERVYTVPEMALRGAYQRKNAACAIAAAEMALLRAGFGIGGLEAAVTQALAETTLPGRLTIVALPGERLVVLDGAHNALAAESLAEALVELKAEKQIARTVVILGMLTGHDPRPVAEALVTGIERLYVCNPNWRRAIPATELAESIAGVVPEDRMLVVPEVRQAVLLAVRESQPHDMILITGSFYAVGEVSPEWISAIEI